MSWPLVDRRKAALVAKRDLKDAVSELRLIVAMVGLTLAIPIAAGSGVRAMAVFGGGTAVVNRLALVGAFFVVFIPASFSNGTIQRRRPANSVSSASFRGPLAPL